MISIPLINSDRHIFAEHKDKISQDLARNRAHIGKSKTLLVEDEAKITQPVAAKRFLTRKAWLKNEETLGNKITEQATVPDPIAIIGMSGRFAQSDTLNDFWKHLSSGTDLIRPISRWNLASHCANQENSDQYCNQGSFLDDIDQFDPIIFQNI